MSLCYDAYHGEAFTTPASATGRAWTAPAPSRSFSGGYSSRSSRWGSSRPRHTNQTERQATFDEPDDDDGDDDDFEDPDEQQQDDDLDP